MSDNLVYCSFCGKHQHEVATIVTAPPSIAICDHCIFDCIGIVFDQNRDKTKRVEAFQASHIESGDGGQRDD